MTSRHVCIVSGFFPPSVGGVERYTTGLALAMLDLGWDVSVLTSRLPGTKSYEEIHGMRIYRLPTEVLGGGRFPVPIPSRQTRRSLANLRATKPDVVVLQTHLYLLSRLGAGLGGRLEVPTVLIGHGSGHLGTGNRILDMGLHAYEHLQVAYLRRRVDRVYGVSEAALQWWKHFGVTGNGVVHNGIDPTSIQPRAVLYKKRLGMAASEVLVVFIGRLIAEKGALSAASAFLSLSSEIAGVHFAVAGDGPEAIALARLAAENPRLHLLGSLPHVEVMDLLASADILAYPSRYPEGLPTSILEAGASGCAVIATVAGGITEALRPDIDGVIVADDEGLRLALRHLVLDSAARTALATSFRDRVREMFTWPIIGRHFSADLAELLA